jgi:hypothetical protein
MSKQCGILNISLPCRPPRPVMKIALLFFLLLLDVCMCMWGLHFCKQLKSVRQDLCVVLLTTENTQNGAEQIHTHQRNIKARMQHTQNTCIKTKAWPILAWMNHLVWYNNNNNNTYVASVREWTIPTERPPPVGEVSANFWGLIMSRGQRGSIFGFLNRRRYFFLQLATQLYSRGWVDHIPGPILFRRSGSAGNRTRTSGSVARSSNY